MQYIIVQGGSPQRYSLGELRRDNPSVSFPRTPSAAVLAEYNVYELQPTEPPGFNPLTQRLVEVDPVETSPGVWEQAWAVEDYTEAEIRARQFDEDVRETTRPDNLTRSLAVLTRTVLGTTELDSLPDEDLAAVSTLYAAWVVGEDVVVDVIRKYDGVLWVCLQPHTTQADWTPDVVPALWARYREPAPGPQVWIAGEQVQVDDIRYWPTINDTAYRVIQAHTTQLGWEPPNVPALFEVA